MQSRCKFSIFLKSFIFFQGMTTIKKGKICDSPAGAEELNIFWREASLRAFSFASLSHF